MEQVAHDFVPVFTRFFVALWNWLMRLLIRVGLMSAFKTRPWLHAVLIFLLMAIAPYVGIFFLVAALVASGHGAKIDNNFMGVVPEKKSERFMDAESDEEEREAYQGEAMLRVYESGLPIEDTMKAHDAVGKLYDMKKTKEESMGRNQTIPTKRGQRLLTISGWIAATLAVAYLVLVACIEQGGFAGRIAYMAGMTLDLPTIITVAVARYARRAWRVVAAVMLAALLGELLVAITSPTGDFGSMLLMRLAGQATVALIIRALFKKRREFSSLSKASKT
jgi:hypothetical protein